jgi:hypothetical protein
VNGTSTIRWLYDLEIGGKPAAFKCLLCPICLVETCKVHHNNSECGFVCKSLRGMKQHQRIVHDFVPQKRIEFTKADLAVQDGKRE